MEMFHRILKTAVDGGASDVHLKIGNPVVFRINRQLSRLNVRIQRAEWMNKIVERSPRRIWRSGWNKSGKLIFPICSKYRTVPHEPLSAARAVVPGHALRQDDCAEL